jgi:acyl dehydratase
MPGTELTSLNHHYDDLEVGDTFSTQGRTVTEADLVAFSGLSGDYSLVHTNEEYAASTPFGARIAHGTLTLAIASGLDYRLQGTGESKVLAFYGFDRVRFIKPVLMGDTIHLDGEVAEITPREDGMGVVMFQVTIANQRDETVAVYSKRTLHSARPPQD